MKEVSQIKPRLGQGRAGLRCKIKTKVLAPDSTKIQDSHTNTKLCNSSMKHRADISSTNTIQDDSRESAIYPDPVHQLPPKPKETSIPEIPQSLSDINPELNINFE